MLANTLLSPIYVAFSLGEGSDDLSYSKPQVIYAQVSDVKSLVLREDVGNIPNYDRVVVIPYGEKTQYINDQSRLWIEIEPNESANNMDYKIERVGDVIDGNFSLYLTSLTPNYKPLYYAHNGSILRAKVSLDKLVALVPFNQYLPIDKATKVWLTSPSDINSTRNLVRLTKKEKLKNSYRLFFERVL